MPSKKKSADQVISLDSFGSAKDYWICWVKSPLTPLSVAKKVQTLLKQPCAYIGGIGLPDVHESLNFPMFLTSFSNEYDANLVILANRVTAPMELSMEQQNYLLGGLLFEDEYFLFNNQGLRKVNFSFPQADYILMLSVDKQADMEDYVQLLPVLADNRILCQDTPRNIAQGQKKSKQVLDFIQYMFYESEAAVKDYRRRKLFQKLHHKMSVSSSNCGDLRFPLEDNRMITSALLRREDY